MEIYLDTTSTFPPWPTLFFFCAMLGSTVDTCSFAILVGFGRISSIFNVLGFTRILLLSVVTQGLQHGEVCTVGAPIEWTARAYGIRQAL